MYTIISVPRINALGNKGPETSGESILEGIPHKTIPVDNEDILKDEKTIYDYALSQSIQKHFFVGGDHSITYPLGKVFFDTFGKENSYMIIFDAHADLMEPTQNPTHEEVFKGLLDYGFNPEQMLFIGLRKIEPEEQHIIDEQGIHFFKGTEDPTEIISFITKQTQGKKLYVSMDIDAFDPSIAPGVSYREKAGMSKENFFSILKAIKTLDVQTYDLVEIVSQKDIDEKTIRLAREIVSTITQ